LYDPVSLEMALASYLDQDERLLWSGQPRHGLRFRALDALLIPFSLLWGGFAVFWETAVIVTGAPVYFVRWGIPFVLVGCYIVFGRFIVDAHRRARTFYGVTDERILIVSGSLAQQVKSLQLRTLTDISLNQRRDGSGTITFGPTDFTNIFLTAAWPGTGRAAPPCFDLIEQAREAYDIIRNAQRSAFSSDKTRAVIGS
jgi:hypothetical protein